MVNMGCIANTYWIYGISWMYGIYWGGETG